ncbi:WPP DOMAIN-ASSOCIATED PROTEIN [Salix koriyanagi]|uniref:WPP DOMAIN-ASSOCIATED PROTEIN n=1 Tax=Salix koriyanagi TaxID=2511006 RepID=A0A9Q0X039_9ROSI|nr:WPP DOMAIN-ASSOCIATED PROTEIN [Salix koriyanagi]
MSDSAESLDNMDRLESLRKEKHELQDLLEQKTREINLLSSQVSDAAEKMSQHSRTEANLFRMITNLKSSIEDAHIEATISEYLYKLLLKEFMGQIECSSKESDLEHNIMEGVLEIVLQDAFKEAEEKLSTLNLKYTNDKEVLLSLEMKDMEKEKALRVSIEEKEKLQQEIHLLTVTIKEKDKLVQESANELEKDKENFVLVSRELDKLKVEKQSLVEARDREHREALTSILALVKGFNDFESRATKEIERKSLRLEDLISQSGSLIQKASILKRTGFLYKKKLESSCSDLQKAEAEVDLLGDKVESLQILLEKDIHGTGSLFSDIEILSWNY